MIPVVVVALATRCDRCACGCDPDACVCAISPRRNPDSNFASWPHPTENRKMSCCDGRTSYYAPDARFAGDGRRNSSWRHRRPRRAGRCPREVKSICGAGQRERNSPPGDPLETMNSSSSERKHGRGTHCTLVIVPRP
jgi:hypothetical protein